ncbi:MAG TPA: hypothetical protein VMV69_27380 [Pirellulales bacterium]|nr:hypothetical protein [Pirellulales bacterium]
MIARRRPAGGQPPHTSPPSPPARGGRGRPQFTLRGLMATVVLLCVPFAIWGGLLREGARAAESKSVLLYIVLVMAAPLLVALLVSLVKPAVGFWRWLRGH